jgi:TPR repeat protein
MRRSLPLVFALLFALEAVAQAPDVRVLSALGDVDSLRSLGDAGNVEAQARLCSLYWTGRRIPQDFTEAAKWCRPAAEQGHVDAQTVLGSLYMMGHGVRRSQKDAVKWLTPAASKGYARAQSVLGTVYEYGGHDLAPDKVRAHMWFNVAAVNFLEDKQIAAEFSAPDQATTRTRLIRFAERDRADAAQSRTRVERTMTAAQIAEAQRLAREWRPSGKP